MFSDLRKSLSWKKKTFKAALRRKLLQRFGSNVVGIVVQAKSGTYVVDPSDAGVGRQLLTAGEYNRAEFEKIASFVTPESSVLVVGAHVGSLVVPLSRCCRTLTAIEANPNTYQLLRMNLRLNQCDNVDAHGVAASDQPGTIEFLINRENSGGSKRKPLHARLDYTYDTPEVRKVSAVPLDQLLAGRSFDLILLDIEGSEYFALKGMRSFLEKAKCLIVEFRPDHLRHVSGVTVEEFLAQIPSRFAQAELPQRGLRCNRQELGTVLQEMYAADQNEDGLILTTPS